MRWIRAHDKAGRVLALPSQTPGLIGRLGLRRDQVDAEAWVVDTSGQKLSGAAAVNRVLDELGGVWRLVGSLYRCPIVAWIEARGYQWFAGHRGWFRRFGITPECERPDVPCG